MRDFSNLLLWFVPFIFSLCFHESAHAWMADRRGDPTAKFLGRLSLNPIVHIDPIGTVLFPIISFLTHFPLIGWARPVPVNERNLRGKWDGMWVAAAGPLSNLLLALIFTGAVYVLNRMPSGAAGVDQAGVMLLPPLLSMAVAGIQINLVLAMFNLLPLPPLDGGRVALGLFPQLREQFNFLERYGFIALMILFYTGIVNAVVFYPTQRLFSFLIGLTV